MLSPSRLASFLLTIMGCLAAQVTTDTVQIGGRGAIGSEGGDPPLLNNGTLATATMRYEFDSATGILRLVVTNTSPVTRGVPNPLITQVYFNLPRGGITAFTLQSQAGSGGATPAFVPSIDLALGQGQDPNRVAPFGSFNVCLETPGDNIRGGIANAAADTIAAPPDSWVVGPVTFIFRAQGNISGLNASAFARAVAQDPQGGRYVSAAVKFQGGGPGGAGSAKIAEQPDCSPSAFVIGEPCIGRRITFTMAGAPGCKGCLILTVNPTPTRFLQYLVPAGPPYIDLFGGELDNYLRTLTLTIPNDPSLVGAKFYYFAVVTRDGRVLEFTQRYELEICR